MESKKRFYEIDLMRFFAAFSVMLFHYTYLHHAESFSTLSHFTQFGYLGVNLFFIISGFVIFFSIQNSNPVKFTISRIVRLYPAYWFCLALTIAGVYVLAPEQMRTLKVFLINLTMLQGFVNIPNIDGSYWSLGVELCFYLLMFGLILFKQIKHALHFFTFWLAATAVMLFKHVPLVHLILIPDYSALFIAGAVFYLVRRDGMSTYKGFILAICYILSVYQTLLGVSELPDTQTVMSQCGSFAIISLFYGLFLMLSLNKLTVANRKFYILLGDMTYPLYLIHQKFGITLIDKLQQITGLKLAVFVVIIMMFMISIFVSRIIEKNTAPILKKALLTLEDWIAPKPLSLATDSMGRNE